MTEIIAGVLIPDSAVVREATELVGAATDELLFNHSRRAYLWGMLHGVRLGLEPDPELLYVAAMFHDLGLTPKFRRTDQRFELDGADAARTFLLEHGYSHDAARKVWLAVALHTTPEIPDRLEPEIALLIAGVATDVVGAAHRRADRGTDRGGDHHASTDRVHRRNPARLPRRDEEPARNHVRHDERRRTGVLRSDIHPCEPCRSHQRQRTP